MAEPRHIESWNSEGGAIGEGLAVVLGTAPATQVKLPAASGDPAIGVTFDATTAAGKVQAVLLRGRGKGIAGAAVTAGDLLMGKATDGRLIKAAAAAGVNIRTIGIALSAAAADGDEIDVLVSTGSFQG